MKILLVSLISLFLFTSGFAEDISSAPEVSILTRPEAIVFSDGNIKEIGLLSSKKALRENLDKVEDEKDFRIGTKVKIKDVLDVDVNDPIIENLKWNRWTNGEFVILGLNDGQARYLAENIDYIKRWIYHRWGFDNYNLVTECRIVCVDDKEWFEKFFNIDKSRSEIRYDEQGKPELMVIFYCLDDIPSKTIPGPLTHMCLLNMDAIHDYTTPIWFLVGSQELNKSLPYIKDKMVELGSLLSNNDPLYFSQGLMEITYEEYFKLSEEDRKKFDLSAMAFLLMIRQEFGQQKTLDFYKECALGKNAEETLKNIFDFQNYDVVDKYFKKYMIKTIDGLKDGKITEKYLQINPD